MVHQEDTGWTLITKRVNSIQKESHRCTAQANKTGSSKDRKNVEKSFPPLVNTTYRILRGVGGEQEGNDTRCQAHTRWFTTSSHSIPTYAVELLAHLTEEGTENPENSSSSLKSGNKKDAKLGYKSRSNWLQRSWVFTKIKDSNAC